MTLCIASASCVCVCVLLQLQPACSALREQCSTESMYTCFGQLFHSFVSGWEGHSKALAYCLVDKTARYLYICSLTTLLHTVAFTRT